MKKITYKRGMQVIFFQMSYGMAVSAGTVTTVRDGTVYVRFKSQYDWTFTYKFDDEPSYKPNTYRLWQLRPLRPGEDIEALEKRLKHAFKLYNIHNDAFSNMQREVESEARAWQREEESRRGVGIPNGPGYIQRVASRAGFTRPKNY